MPANIKMKEMSLFFQGWNEKYTYYLEKIKGQEELMMKTSDFITLVDDDYGVW